MTSRLAAPSRGLSVTSRSRRIGRSAASACISPSTCSSGAAWRTSRSASRIFRAVGELLAPKLECDSSAALGVRPNRRTTSAPSRVISATCWLVGSTMTWVSAMNSGPVGRTRQVIE